MFMYQHTFRPAVVLRDSSRAQQSQPKPLTLCMRACVGPQPGCAYSEATGRARLEQVRVEHRPDHQLLDKALGGFLAGDVVPGDLHARGPPSGLGL